MIENYRILGDSKATLHSLYFKGNAYRRQLHNIEDYPLGGKGKVGMPPTGWPSLRTLLFCDFATALRDGLTHLEPQKVTLLRSVRCTR